MKNSMLGVLVFLSFFLMSSIGAQENDLTLIASPYLNQNPPGMTPEIFDPAIATDWGVNVNLPSFDSSGTKCIFISDFKLFETEVHNGVWSIPKEIDLGSEFEGHGIFGHGLSRDWKRLYFNSLKPAPDSCSVGRVPIWLSSRHFEKWSRPECIGQSGMAISEAGNGNIYFTSWVNGTAQIACCHYIDGVWNELEILPEPIISEYEAMHPCIASDEGFLIFDSEDRPGIGSCELFVSFHTENGGWSEPVTLGQIITQENASMARLTADDRFLFFNDRSGQMYWVSTAILQQLKPEDI
jgi:hypothetical protein